MKFIAHRGNITGPNTNLENKPNYIDKAISSGYEVEIDIRFISNELYLGHDTPQYKIDISWLKERSSSLWIHCKNIDGLGFFNKINDSFKYFWHQEDEYTLTSNKKIWTYPNKKLYLDSICVMPEKGINGNINLCYGICSDYIKEYNEKYISNRSTS